ncbi:MAG: hypothetical protein ABFS21_02965 [Actinomycetota bacterium]
MRISRTTTVLIVTIALLTVWAIPAGAGRPAELVKVTMALADEDAQGFTTDCVEIDGTPIDLIMVRNQDGLGEGDKDPILGVYMDDVVWSRGYPEEASDIGFSECHGGLLAGSMEMNTYMQISMDRKTGAVTDLVWHFDRYFIDGVPMELPNGKTRDNGIVLENFSLIGHDLLWNADTSTVSGWFELSYYLRDDTGKYVGSDPVDPVQWFEFTLTTEPVS